MLDADQLQALRAAYRSDNFYLGYCSEQSQQVLEEMIDDPYFPGSTDPPVLGLLGLFLRTIQPRRVLQLGTHIGFSALFIADILNQNARQGHLVTVDPDQLAHKLARNWSQRANLDDAITFLDGYSTDPDIAAQLGPFKPFDLIFLDSSHAYQPTLQELDLIFERGPWISDSGILLLHDTAALAAQWDASGEGGVPRAVKEWLSTRKAHYRYLSLELPLWPSMCGVGLLTPRNDSEA